MAKHNKYTSINFNHIYEKTISTNTTSNAPKNHPSLSPSASFSSASYSAVSAPNKPHGRVLVLTRPTPKPVTPPAHAPPPQQQPQHPPDPIQRTPDQPCSEPGSDAISLRPLGRTGPGSNLSGPVVNHEKDKDLAPPLISPKPNKFVPPHLRPGYVPREDGPAPEAGRGREPGHKWPGHGGSPGRFGEEGRPKSGGYDRIRRGPGGLSDMGRPRSSGSRPNSSGSRPNSSGWFVSLS